jgi:hypothetical protein
MVVEIIITEQAWCDLHLRIEEVKVAATASHIIAFDGGKPRQLDVCAEHDRTVTLADLPEYLASYGTVIKSGKRTKPKSSTTAQTQPKPPTRKRAQEAEQKCPVPGCTKVLRSGGGLASHLRVHTEAEQKRARRTKGEAAA